MRELFLAVARSVYGASSVQFWWFKKQKWSLGEDNHVAQKGQLRFPLESLRISWVASKYQGISSVQSCPKSQTSNNSLEKTRRGFPTFFSALDSYTPVDTVRQSNEVDTTCLGHVICP